jgi:hypothetical protein
MDAGYDYPGGQFYTLTWDLMQLLVDLQERTGMTSMAENIMLGYLLYDGKETWNLDHLSNPIAFDYSDEDARQDSAWAVDSCKREEWAHAVTKSLEST